MKKIFLLPVLILAVTIAGCRRDRVASQHEKTFDGTWKVVMYQKIATGQTFTKSSPESGLSGQDYSVDDIIVTLNRNKNTLRLKGHTGTNEVTGLFVLKTSDRLSCSGFGGTKVSEPNWGGWFWDAMNAADAYQLQENTLTIYYHSPDNPEDKRSVTLQRQ